MEKIYDLVLARLKTSENLSLLGLRTLAFLNGGAIIGLLTLLGHTPALKVDLRTLGDAFVWFIVGLVADLVAILLGYLSQNQIAQFEMRAANAIYENLVTGEPRPLDQKAAAPGSRTLWGAIACACISVIAFAAGSFVALHAMSLRP